MREVFIDVANSDFEIVDLAYEAGHLAALTPGIQASLKRAYADIANPDQTPLILRDFMTEDGRVDKERFMFAAVARRDIGAYKKGEVVGAALGTRLPEANAAFLAYVTGPDQVRYALYYHCLMANAVKGATAMFSEIDEPAAETDLLTMPGAERVPITNYETPASPDDPMDVADNLHLYVTFIKPGMSSAEKSAATLNFLEARADIVDPERMLEQNSLVLGHFEEELTSPGLGWSQPTFHPSMKPS